MRGSSIGADTFADRLWRARTGELLVSSVALTLAVCLTCLVLGVATAWVLSTVRLPGQAWWWVVSALPLAAPSYVTAFGWLSTIPGWKGFLPAWFVLSVVCVPYVTLTVGAALRRADADLIDVARSLGRSPWAAWRAGMLPQISPAAGAGTLLVALYVLSDFGAVALLRYPVFTFAIQRQYGSFIGRDNAVVLALVLVLLALAVVGLERWIRGRGLRRRIGAGTGRPVERRAAGRATVPCMALLLIAPVAALGVPVVALFRRLAQGTARTLDPTELLSAVGSTVAVAAGGALLALVLAVPIGVLAARHRGPVVTVVEAGGFSGHALPGIVVALSLVYFSLRVVPSLYQGVLVLMFAYAVLFLPKAIGATRTSVAQVSPALTEVAQSLGRRPLAAHRAVTWPLATPGVAAGALLVMLTAMKELPATLLLRPTGMDTLATEIWSRTSAAAYGAAAPYALALLVVAAVPAFLLSRPVTWDGPR
ncbi:ABC transporter permease [Aeromicrobium sp. CTD01-1L150]|uniref:ABC transporter permease n=1 Tax=Aeromicrobium sp. CTD01-1L150 TaxID=3341830 RepID=UPI0035C1A47F